LRNLENIADFRGMLVFDKWTCNTNGRQAIFFREPGGEEAGDSLPGLARGGSAPAGYTAGADVAGGYVAMMIDFGFCFNAGEWDFPDAPLRGLYARHRVYQNVSGMESFEPWLERLETQMTGRVLGEEASQIPPEWYAGDWRALEQLIERLDRRRGRVRELIFSARNSGRDPFPNWKVAHA
jgi:hypothetical protein